MKIVYAYADDLSQWDRSERRCAVPARALNRTGLHSAELISKAEFAASAIVGKAHNTCQDADLIVVQGSPSRRTLKAVQMWRARDKVIVADIDRAEHLLHPPIDPHEVRMGLKLVHAVTLPSRRLTADYAELVPAFYLPSYIEPQQYNHTRRPPDGCVRIGWRGGEAHANAFLNSGVAQALQQVCRARPQVHVVLCTTDARLSEALRLPAGQVTWQPWTPFSEWPDLLASFDIGIAPLDGPLDQRRCWSQALEYMLQRIPWVASAGPTFQELGQFGWLIKNQTQAWERVLLDIIDHLDEYRAEAERDAFLFALSQSIDDNVDKIVNLYTRVVADAAAYNGIPDGRAGVRLI